MLPDDDFLLGAELPGLAAAEALEAVREVLVAWAAGALLARHPQARLARGAKGLAAARRDLDFHVRHLHAALVGGDEADLRAYVNWFAQVRPAGDVQAEVAMVREALQRFLPEAESETAQATWAGVGRQLSVALPLEAR